MTADYLFQFAQAHDGFRIPELLSVSELYGIRITFPEDDLTKRDVSRPFMVLGLESEEDVRQLARRCILIKCVSLPIPVRSLLTVLVFGLGLSMSSGAAARPMKTCSP